MQPNDLIRMQLTLQQSLPHGCDCCSYCSWLGLFYKFGDFDQKL